jgi:hypothetical protein
MTESVELRRADMLPAADGPAAAVVGAVAVALSLAPRTPPAGSARGGRTQQDLAGRFRYSIGATYAGEPVELVTVDSPVGFLHAGGGCHLRAAGVPRSR